MAGRIRTIKPEILTDSKTARLSDAAWRLFVSSWLLADDAGRFPADLLVIAGQIFPGRSFAEVEVALEECARAGLLTVYDIRDQQFAEIAGWAKHQKINRPSGPKFPGPDEELPKAHGALTADSVKAHGGLYADHDHDRRPSTKTSTRNATATNARARVGESDLAAVYDAYPKKAGKAIGLKKLAAKLKSGGDYETILKAAHEMAQLWRGQDMQFCPEFKTWVNQERWQDERQAGPSRPSRGAGMTPDEIRATAARLREQGQ